LRGGRNNAAPKSRQRHLPSSKNPAGTFDREHEKTAVQKYRVPWIALTQKNATSVQF
jgi:hypothetical protein